MEREASGVCASVVSCPRGQCRKVLTGLPQDGIICMESQLGPDVPSVDAHRALLSPALERLRSWYVGACPPISHFFVSILRTLTRV